MAADGMGGAALEANADIVVQTVYDQSSRITRRIDDGGSVTAYLYDGMGRELVRRMADGTIHQVGTGLGATAWQTLASPPDLSTGFAPGYDDAGNAFKVTDATGTVVTTAFDRNDRPTTVGIALGSAPTASLGGTTGEAYAYDGLGRITRADNDFARVLRAYDSRGNIVSEFVNTNAPSFPAGFNGPPVAYAYDDANNEVSCTYPSGRVVHKRYDALNRLVEVSDDAFFAPGGRIALYTYAGPGRVATRTYGNDTRASYTFAGFLGDDARVLPTDPEGGARLWLRPAGVGVLDSGFMQTRRIHHERNPSGTPTTLEDREFWWDASGNKVAAFDARDTFVDRRSRLFGYDSADRLASSDDRYTDALATRSDFGWAYDLDGVHNREEVTVTLGTAPPSATTPRIFGENWGETRSTAAAGERYALTGDDGPVNQYTLTPGREHFYDENGNLTINGDPLPGDADEDYDVDMDDLQAIIDCLAVSNPSTDPQCIIDADTNGDEVVDLDDLLDAQLNLGFSHDNARLRYDYRNQLIGYTKLNGPAPALEVRYVYDAFNRLIERERSVIAAGLGGGTGPIATLRWRSRYGGRAGWQLLERVRTQDLVFPVPPPFATEHVYGTYIDEVLQTRVQDDAYSADADADADAYYHHQDDLFSVIAITDRDGHPVERSEYSDYGEFSITDAVTGDRLDASLIDNEHTFTGRLVDADTGLLEYRHRWYAPTLGRFVQPDPLGFADSMNRRVLAISNPLRYIDPLGLTSQCHADLLPITIDGQVMYCEPRCINNIASKLASDVADALSALARTLSEIDSTIRSAHNAYRTAAGHANTVAAAAHKANVTVTALKLAAFLTAGGIPGPGWAVIAGCMSRVLVMAALRKAAINTARHGAIAAARHSRDAALRAAYARRDQAISAAWRTIDSLNERARERIRNECCQLG